VTVERATLERRITASLDAGRIPVVLSGCGSGRTSLLLRLEATLGRERSQYLDLAAAATTPERCLRAVLAVSHVSSPGGQPPAPTTTAGAFAALVDYFDELASVDRATTVLIDEFLDIRTFENFPGLRDVQSDFARRLARSPTRFVLASRFTNRVHRLLRDGSPRFEVIHMPPLESAEVAAMAELIEGHRPDRLGAIAPVVTTLAGGHAATAYILLGALASFGAALDPVAAMAAAFAPHAALTARWRECYELRLHRARGYGALKAILGILAEAEPLNLTEIAQQLRRTPGSTKDYLSWLEDVDLVVMRGKRYSYTEPLLRLYVRLYGRPIPPTDDDIVREVSSYARSRLPIVRPAVPPTVLTPADVASDGVRSGIIEID